MPEPFNRWSSDYPVYRYLLNPLAKRICFVHPNLVTLACLITTIPIVLNILNNGSAVALVLWFVLKALLDCLDGSVARTCNRSSKLGALLDTLSDGISTIAIAACLAHVIVKRKLFKMPQIAIGIISVLWCIILPIGIYIQIFGKEHGILKIKSAWVIHDNSVIVSIVAAVIINFFIKN